jgi:hypothetical protein
MLELAGRQLVRFRDRHNLRDAGMHFDFPKVDRDVTDGTEDRLRLANNFADGEATLFKKRAESGFAVVGNAVFQYNYHSALLYHQVLCRGNSSRIYSRKRSSRRTRNWRIRST